MSVPSSFRSRGPRVRGDVPIVVRRDLSGERAQQILEQIHTVDWAAYEHAYGRADDVAGQLAAVTVGDDETRKVAWWNLWGNVHHQGTVYPATEPTVTVLHALSAWREYPDRRQAILFLTEIGCAVRVGSSTATRIGVHAGDAWLPGRLAAAITEATAELVADWAGEAPAIRRALTLLVAVQPDSRRRFRELVEPELPELHRTAWLEYCSSVDSDEAEERRELLEHWAHGES